MKIRTPEYYPKFKCLASRCPDSCCQAWAVDIDESTAQYYRSLPGALGDRLRVCLKEEQWGTVLALEENGRCPMWRGDGLCRIQAELGEDALSRVCKTFPRLCHDYGSFQELGLELSCPEAARLILESTRFSQTETTVPGGDAPDYDENAMAILLGTRQRLMSFIDSRCLPIRETLAATLLYGYHVQEALDWGEAAVPAPSASLVAALDPGAGGDIPGLLAFFQSLEILTPQWTRRLRGPISREMPESLRPLLRYFLARYYLQAVSDGDIVCRVKLAVVSCTVIAALGGELAQTAQLYAKEIENDPDNIDALLDGARTAPGLSDRNLLGLLLNKG